MASAPEVVQRMLIAGAPEYVPAAAVPLPANAAAAGEFVPATQQAGWAGVAAAPAAATATAIVATAGAGMGAAAAATATQAAAAAPAGGAPGGAPATAITQAAGALKPPAVDPVLPAAASLEGGINTPGRSSGGLAKAVGAAPFQPTAEANGAYEYGAEDVPPHLLPNLGSATDLEDSAAEAAAATAAAAAAAAISGFDSPSPGPSPAPADAPAGEGEAPSGDAYSSFFAAPPEQAPIGTQGTAVATDAAQKPAAAFSMHALLQELHAVPEPTVAGAAAEKA